MKKAFLAVGIVLTLLCVVGIVYFANKDERRVPEKLDMKVEVLAASDSVEVNGYKVMVCQSYYKSKDNIDIYFRDEDADVIMANKHKREAIKRELEKIDGVKHVKMRRNDITMTITQDDWSKRKDAILEVVTKKR